MSLSCNQSEKNRNTNQETKTTIKNKEDSVTDKQTNRFTESKIVIPEYYSILNESPSNGRKMKKVFTDLDNDKKADTTFIVENKSDFSNYILLIYLTSQNKTFRYKLIDNFDPDFRIYPVQLKIKKNVLEVGCFRDGTAAFGRFLKFRFDANKKTFRLIGYNSGYKSGAGEHCDKSYNLIDGTYIVNYEKSLPNVHKETYKGKKIIEKIFINDIDVDVLNKLDEVGNEFEN